jgi:hypothetical protein
MTGFSEELWYGTIRPQELDEASDSESLLCFISDEETELRALLNDAQKRVFDRLMFSVHEYASAARAESFSKGFRLGAGCMLDVIGRDN